MHYVISALSSTGTSPGKYDRLPIFLFPLLSVLAVLFTLLLTRTRRAAQAVFLHPFDERTVIAKSGKDIVLYAEGDTGNPGNGSGPDNPPDKPPDDPEQGPPAASARPPLRTQPTPVAPTGQAREVNRPRAPGTGDQVRGH